MQKVLNFLFVYYLRTPIIPPYVPHEFYALEDTIDIDFFSPVREDWLNNTANYIQNPQQK